MGNLYTIPLIYTRTGDAPVDRDLSSALIFWTLENEREKGGGFFRKKEAERITQVAILYRPILVTKYRGIQVAFDGCRVASTEFKFGIAPSLTQLRNYLVSDAWEMKPESYAGGLDLQSQSFERAVHEYSHVIPGWITSSKLLGELSDLLELVVPSEPRPDVLPQLVTYDSLRQSFEDLDGLKRILSKEVEQLKGLELELVEKTSDVLAPIKEECARIESQYDKRINEIRPSVVSNKQKYEDQRAEHHEEIEKSINPQLRDLKDRLTDVRSKIDSYEGSGVTPRGGIDKQYSLRDNLEAQIRELEKEKRSKIKTLDDKYDQLIEQEQDRIDSLEEAKSGALREPLAKIKLVQSATDRLIKAMQGLAKSHEPVISLGQNSNLVLPKQVDSDEFVTYVPITITSFESGTRARRYVSSVSLLKDSKGVTGSLKSVFGMKQSPLEKTDDLLTDFASSAVENPKLNRSVSSPALRFDILTNTQTMGLVASGIAKMQSLGWLKPKEAAEFQKSIEENFVSSGTASIPVEKEVGSVTEADGSRSSLPLVRFINYNGVETQVQLGKLEELRRVDAEEFNKGAPGMRSATSESVRLLRYLKSIKIPHNKQYCIEKKEDWVQNQLYIMLANSEFRGRLHKERKFSAKDVESRIDFDVSGVGIEVKIFRSVEDFQRLSDEMVRYTREYSEIFIPYINAGFTDERLNSEFRFLTEKFGEIKGYFELNCSDIES